MFRTRCRYLTCRITTLESLFGAAMRPSMNGENMKYLFAAVLVASTVAGFSAANAAGGCGPGFHRGPYGGCPPNGGVGVGERPRGAVEAPAAGGGPRGRGCPRGFSWRFGRRRPL